MGYLKQLQIEMQEDEQGVTLAKILGVSYLELQELDYEIEEDASEDGLIYNYRVEFSSQSPKRILAKIKRLVDGKRVLLGPNELDQGHYYEDDFDYEEQFEAITSAKNYLEKFKEEINNLDMLNQLEINNLSLEPVLKRQIFVGVVATLETFLSDSFINLTNDYEQFFKNFIETHPEFSQRKFELREIFVQTEKLKETAMKVMLDTLYHNLPVVKQMFSATFKIQIPEIKEIYKLVLMRHDLVHRNGKTKEGEQVFLNKIKVEEAIKITSEFVYRIASTLNASVKALPELPF